ncbi:MAG: Hsp20/alpha crystallin family protein [Deltaproteobacteria bacterium]|nr:Hsp20/alpha crystallin family protein [Deltaproteobacteria bacterium]
MKKVEYPIIPPVDVYETAGEVVVCIDLPGVAKSQVEVSVEGNVLEVCGRKLPGVREVRSTFALLEREYGHFNLAIELPGRLEPRAARAEMEAGVLVIRIPRRQ